MATSEPAAYLVTYGRGGRALVANGEPFPPTADSYTVSPLYEVASVADYRELNALYQWLQGSVDELRHRSNNAEPIERARLKYEAAILQHVLGEMDRREMARVEARR